jgi:hypothetical protein
MIPSPVAILENLTAIANDWRGLAARGTCSSAREGDMRTVIQLSPSVVFMALTSAPARADLIIYDMFGAVGELNMEGNNPLISLGISTGDAIHLVVHVDTDAPDLCGQPGKGLYPLPFAALELNGTIYSQIPEPLGGAVEVNNAAGNCEFPGDDHTGVAIRLLIGPVGMTLFGPSQIGESLPAPLFSPDGVGGLAATRIRRHRRD